MAKSKGDKILDAVAALSAHGVKFPKLVRYVTERQGAQITNPDCVAPWWGDHVSVQKHIADNKDAYFVSEYGTIDVAIGPNCKSYYGPNGLIQIFGDATIEETLIYLAGLEAIKDSIQFLPKTTGMSIKEVLYG